jgi:type III restriction enzyme
MKKVGTRDIPLKLAKSISQLVNEEFNNGSMLTKVTPTTRDLLSYWFCEPHTENRSINFNEGQRQSLLNIIYIHEVLKLSSVKDVYLHFNPQLLGEINSSDLDKPKYQIPKYAVKVATGVGKTWIMNSLLIWQILNAKYEDVKSGLYTRNFLIVSPGLIVYERLLDAYLGKEEVEGGRNFYSSDFYQYQELFIPPHYREEVFGFIQNNVVKKEEIGKKITGDGMISITNWHLFMSGDDSSNIESLSPLDDPSFAVNDIFPIKPGSSGGNNLTQLDNAYLRGNELNFLSSLPDLMVINDEAHHIHETKTFGEIEEVEWQKGLNKISENKGRSFIQLDFSATPYEVVGGVDAKQHFFPHIVVDFNLTSAIKLGLVKMITIDKRKSLADLPSLDFNAIRDSSKKVIGLSEGQKLMIRAGVTKLLMIEKSFETLGKYPKMMIVCEDTNVSPFVEKFLIEDGISSSDILRVDSNRKGEIKIDDWNSEKQKLFNIDKHPNPKIIISVMMLREGFDVSNICVIVPLRSAGAKILLEQTIGRGLRLMYREPEYQDIKKENLKKVLIDKEEPNGWFDILFIVEHPRFIDFYNDLKDDGVLGEFGNDEEGGKELGDIIKVGLKEDYQKYDFHWINIIREAEEEIVSKSIDPSKLNPFKSFSIEQLKNILGTDGEEFVSQELTIGTQFGNYKITSNLFSSTNYTEYLQRILSTINNRIEIVGNRKKELPTLQIHQIELIKTIDTYIRNYLFGEPFNPFDNSNWKILLSNNGVVTEHIIKEISKVIYELQNNFSVTEAEVSLTPFSKVSELKMRENYSIPIRKTIYERLRFPSNKGIFEKDFMTYADIDTKVISIIKIDEYQHRFSCVSYIRTDGLMSSYYPDFLVMSEDKIYIVETKGKDKIGDQNVKQKQLSVLNKLNKINELLPEKRMGKIWEYVLLGDNHFYGLKNNNATTIDILELAKVSEGQVKGELFN